MAYVALKANLRIIKHVTVISFENTFQILQILQDNHEGNEGDFENGKRSIFENILVRNETM